MNITSRSVSRDYLRNGKLNLSNATVSSISSYGGGGTLSGNYLPATLNEDGSYTVDLSKVLFNGHIIASGDVAAYGSTEGSGGSTVVGNVTIYDGLDSDSIEMALSANQGRVLYGYIGNTEEVLDQIIGTGSIDGGTTENGGNVDLSNYYTKAEVDAKIQDSGTTDLTNYYTKSEVNSLIDGAGQIDLTNYYTKSEIDTALTNYNTKSEIVNLLKTEQDRITNLEGYFTLANDTLTTSHNIVSTKEITSYSDARLKSNIKPLINRGELKPVTYIKDGKESIGFIAQDVAELYPELVIQDGEYMALNYQQLTAVLAAQINELKKEIEELKGWYECS